MNEKGQLEELLNAWQAPAPRADFEASVLKRLHQLRARVSLWERWFAEPLEQASVLWRQQALATVGMAAVALVLGISLTALQSSRPSSKELELQAFSTFPPGSMTAAYLELVKQ